MKRRSIVVAATAVIALGIWIAWLFAHMQEGNSRAQTEIPVNPSEPPMDSGTEALPPPAGLPSPPGLVNTASGNASSPGVTPNNLALPIATVASHADQAAAATRHMDPAAAMIELQKVHAMIASYHTLMGQNPVGTNAEIMKQLMGGNPHQAMLGPPPGQSLNANGELLDPWGRPYFFHQISGDDMEIHSAGPDGRMGTADDLIIR
jgi:hypothetical protein